MPANVYKWALDASANASIDPLVNWQEGMPPSLVNDSARGMMQGIAAWRNMLGGIKLASGTGTPYAITTDIGLTEIVDGLRIAFRIDTVNTANVTLLVDSLPTKPLLKAGGKQVNAGELRIDAVYEAVYVLSLDAYCLISAPAYHPGIAAAWAALFFPPSSPSGTIHVQGYNINTIIYNGDGPRTWTVTFKNSLGALTPPVGTNPNFLPYTVIGNTSGAYTFSFANKTPTSFNFRFWATYAGNPPPQLTGGGDPLIGGIGFFADFIVFSTAQL
jgi:hypothetical protein